MVKMVKQKNNIKQYLDFFFFKHKHYVISITQVEWVITQEGYGTGHTN